MQTNRRKKKVKALAKLHRKIRNQRKDFHHQTSRKIANSYSVVAGEDIHIKGMMKSNLAKSFSEAGLSKFLSMVEYKMMAKGGLYVKVDRWFASTKTASVKNIIGTR